MLNFGVLTRWAPERKMHLVDICNNIISFKHLLSHTVPYKHDLRTFTLDHHLFLAVRDCTAYPILSSFSLRDFDCHKPPPNTHPIVTRSKNEIKKPTPKYCLITTSLTDELEPASHTKAHKDLSWRLAMFEKFDALLHNRI